MWHAIFTYNGLDLSYCWCSAVSDKVAVYVSKDLYERAEAFIKEQGGFSSVDELVEFLLGEVLSEEAEASMSEEDEEKVKERLRALGYF